MRQGVQDGIQDHCVAVPGGSGVGGWPCTAVRPFSVDLLAASLPLFLSGVHSIFPQVLRSPKSNLGGPCVARKVMERNAGSSVDSREPHPSRSFGPFSTGV